MTASSRSRAPYGCIKVGSGLFVSGVPGRLVAGWFDFFFGCWSEVNRCCAFLGSGDIPGGFGFIPYPVAAVLDPPPYLECLGWFRTRRQTFFRSGCWRSGLRMTPVGFTSNSHSLQKALCGRCTEIGLRSSTLFFNNDHMMFRWWSPSLF